MSKSIARSLARFVEISYINLTICLMDGHHSATSYKLST